MKKCKLFFLSLLAVIFFAFGFTACGDTGLAGTYKFSYVSTTVDGQTVLVYAGDEYEGKLFHEDLMQIVLKEDGTMTISIEIDGVSESVTGTWEQGEGNVITLFEEGESMEVTVEDGKITFDFYGQGIVTLEKD